MITRIQARDYRCLKAIDQPVQPFQILVGPNASGKSAFLDVVAFLGTLVSEALGTAVKERSENFHDLVWGREQNSFELSVEAVIPQTYQTRMVGEISQTICYSVGVRIDPSTDALAIASESVRLRAAASSPEFEVVSRLGNRVRFLPERGDGELAFELPPYLSGLANLPADESKYPVAVWLKNFLREGIQFVLLDNELLRAASPPGQGKAQTFDGLNLARVVARLLEESPDLFKDWLAHVRTSLTDLASVRTVHRPEDKYRYLMLRYDDGVEVPAWAASDGTLRLLALTILAYLPDFKGIYLIEEPENGLHPQALETIFQSLSSVYEGQVLVTSHSPLLLSLAKPEQLLCFQKTPSGTRILNGTDHPVLREWKGEVSLSDLFAAGVLSESI